MPIQRHTEESGETGIDLAPMLDFVLNLLIFFIITTSFVKEAGVEVSRADAETAVHREKGNILIAIRPNGEIWMDRQQVDIRGVRPLIERLHVERPDDSVIIVADKASRTGVLASVMDAVRAGGIPEVSVAAAGVSGE
jgi:biopolymer transport protein ExbD